MPLASQFGVKKESTWGTPVTVDRFQEFLSCGITPVVGRNTSNGIRSGQRVARADRSVPYVSRYEGPFQQEVLSSGFGFWLEHILGTVAAPVEDGANTGVFTHTATIGDVCAKGFTAQVNIPLGECGNTAQAHTYSGCKVTKWSLGVTKEGNLLFDCDIVAKDGTTATALASASYPAGAEVLSWLGGSLEIDGTPILVDSWKLTCDMKMKTDRLALGSGNMRKPVEDGYREFTVEFTCDHENLDIYNRVIAETAAAATEEIVLRAGSPTIIGAVGDVTPAIVVTCPAVRFDEGTPTVSGTSMLSNSVKGMALNSGASGNDAVSLDYITLDATP